MGEFLADSGLSPKESSDAQALARLKGECAGAAAGSLAAAGLPAVGAGGVRAAPRHRAARHLDGRNRLLACERAGVEPAFTDFKGDDAQALVISLNAQRRDLTAGQRAVTAARVWGLDGYARAGRPGKAKLSESPTISIRQVCARFKVSDKPVMQARDLLAEAPDLAERVAGGTLTLAAAHEEFQTRREEAAQKARPASAIRRADPAQ